MSTPNFEAADQALVDGLNQSLYARVVAARPLEVLSTHNDKLLQVVQAEDGEKFVTRSYTPEAIADIKHNYSFGFRAAWDGMHEAFADAGLTVVRSGLIETEGEHPFIVVSEYLEDGQPLAKAPVETKKAVATGLGKLLTTEGYFVPAPEMIREDMFLVVERDGETKAVVADVDPLVTPSWRMQKSDRNSAFFIDKLAELAWDRWCTTDEERIAVTSAMVISLSDFALDKFDFDSATTRAFMDLHLMSNGVGNRNWGRQDEVGEVRRILHEGTPAELVDWTNQDVPERARRAAERFESSEE